MSELTKCQKTAVFGHRFLAAKGASTVKNGVV
jgi:hypothetical protein